MDAGGGGKPRTSAPARQGEKCSLLFAPGFALCAQSGSRPKHLAVRGLVDLGVPASQVLQFRDKARRVFSAPRKPTPHFARAATSRDGALAMAETDGPQCAAAAHSPYGALCDGRNGRTTVPKICQSCRPKKAMNPG